ncbi:Mrp/NBP35 family ATP-binding protein [bacterium]|nr:Mrp/NBP35 family ATP-binding protein [bacterium]
MSSKAGSKTMQVLDALRSIEDPKLGKDMVALGMVKNLSIRDGSVKFDLLLGEESGIDEDELERQLDEQFRAIPWIKEVQFGLIAAAGAARAEPGAGTLTEAPPQQAEAAPQPPGAPPQQAGSAPREKLLESVKYFVAVGSGKGGVGKSTVSVNLALAMAKEGAKIGVLDADVYGPSVPLMLGLEDQPLIGDGDKLIPPQIHGLKVMSMGLLLKSEQAVVWRGPMIHGVIQQFLSDVEWGELDYLIVDLPPGTGDAPLSLIQALPLTAAVVVSTPQKVAASVAQKAMSMFSRMGLRTLGVIENMSYFNCPHCGEQSDVFDRGGGRKLAEDHGVPFLGEIPLDMRMRQGADAGEPVVLQFPDSDLAGVFYEIAREIARQMEQATNVGSPA